MQVTGKTKIGEEKQLTVEIRDVEIVKPKIEKSIKKTDVNESLKTL